MTMTAPALAIAGLAFATLFGMAPTVASAQATSPASSDPASVQGGGYTIEPNHTQVLFSVSHMGFSTFHGQFTKASGTLSLDPRSPADSRFEIHVPTRSVLTSNATLTGELKGDAWLDAKADPDIVFKSTKVTPMGNGEADVVGDLTLHGQTHPVTLHAKLVGAGVNPLDKRYTVGFDLSGTLQRSEFGVKTYLPLIGDAVTLTIAGVFEKQA